MAEIYDIHTEKMKVLELFKKTPIATVNDHFFGLAWLMGDFVLHKHDVDEFYLVMEGHLTIEVSGKIHELDPGMGIKIEKGEPHRSHSERMTLVAIFEPQKIKPILLE